MDSGHKPKTLTRSKVNYKSTKCAPSMSDTFKAGHIRLFAFWMQDETASTPSTTMKQQVRAKFFHEFCAFVLACRAAGIVMTPEERTKAHMHGVKALNQYDWLSRTSREEGTQFWPVRPKTHAGDHIVSE